MPEEIWALQRTQWGKQAALYTPNAATIRLAGLSVDDEPDPTFHEFGPQGELAQTIEAAGITSSMHKIAGRADYNEFVWWLAGLLGNVVPAHPAGGTTSWERLWTPPADQPWTPMLITQERGDDTRGRQYPDLVISGFTVTCGPDKYDPTGDAFASAVKKNTALTASLAALTEVPILGPDTKVYLDTTNEFAGSPTQLTRYFECQWGVTGVYAPEWAGGVNAGLGYSLYVQPHPTMTGQLTVESDSTAEDLILGLQASDAIGYLRIESISTVLAESGHPYKLVIDSAIKFKKQSAYKAVGSASALLGNDYPFTIMKDPTWTTVNSNGQMFQIDLVSTVPAI